MAKVTILSGAGLSAQSGIDTFRDNGDSKMIQLQKLLVKDKETMTLFIREYDSCEDY